MATILFWGVLTALGASGRSFEVDSEKAASVFAFIGDGACGWAIAATSSNVMVSNQRMLTRFQSVSSSDHPMQVRSVSLSKVSGREGVVKKLVNHITQG
jgi:hypothetical protein